MTYLFCTVSGLCMFPSPLLVFHVAAELFLYNWEIYKVANSKHPHQPSTYCLLLPPPHSKKSTTWKNGEFILCIKEKIRKNKLEWLILCQYEKCVKI